MVRLRSNTGRIKSHINNRLVYQQERMFAALLQGKHGQNLTHQQRFTLHRTDAETFFCIGGLQSLAIDVKRLDSRKCILLTEDA